VLDELDGGQPFRRGWNFDEDVGPVQQSPQTSGFLDCALGVMCQVWIDLQPDQTIFALGLVIDRPELIRCPLHIALAESFVDCRSVFSPECHSPNVLVVGIAVGFERNRKNSEIISRKVAQPRRNR